MREPEIVDGGGFTVVGIHYEGTNQQGELAELWERVDESWDALTPVADGQQAYGVSYGGDPETGEFEYVAGVRAAPDATPPDDFATVDVPESQYAVFETSLADIEETMQWVHGEWLQESGYALAMGPEVEVYDPGFDPGDPSVTFAVHVPVARD
ncbi:MAG: GyrI-like domain-containing protein [Halanaeroarchaeum sp.]